MFICLVLDNFPVDPLFLGTSRRRKHDETGDGSIRRSELHVKRNQKYFGRKN